jgi:sulfatase maturation enzyme AslB (radical SAM superfamily)
MNPPTANQPSARTCDNCVYLLKGHGCCNSARDFFRQELPKERTCDSFKPTEHHVQAAIEQLAQASAKPFARVRTAKPFSFSPKSAVSEEL